MLITRIRFYSFFGEVLQIGTPGYLPNETDVLRARQKSFGITETRFTMGQLSWVWIFSAECGPTDSWQNTHVWCRRTTVGAEKMDTLLWERDIHYFLHSTEWIWPSTARREKSSAPSAFALPCSNLMSVCTESDGGVTCPFRFRYQLAVVPSHIDHPISQQDRCFQK